MKHSFPPIRWITILLLTLSITNNGWSSSPSSNATVLSGVDLIEFPAKNQLYPRDLTTNQATITVSGIVQDYTSYEQIRVKIWRSGTLHNTIDQNLIYFGDEANFNINFNITAELKNYTITLYGIEDGDEKFEATASKVVAGDVFIINGQSNALANGSNHPDDTNGFTRSYSFDGSWVLMHQFFPGEWGGRMAKRIIAEHNVPVAIFNEAEGGETIDHFLKDESNPYNTNYQNLYERLDGAGVKDNIRATIWYQGESDGWDLSVEEYKTAFTQLYNDWNADYTVEHYYLFQIIGNGCNHPLPFIFEAHRQVANDLPNLQIMSSNNTSGHDGCHFEYYGGYKTLGNRIYDLVAKDLYNGPDGDIRAGDIIAANLVGNEVIVTIGDVDSLDISGNPWSEFNFGFANAWVSGGYVNGTNIHLQVGGDISTINGVSYYGHSGTANDWVTNGTGVGILLWYDFPVEGGSTENNEPNCDDVVAYTTDNALVLEAINQGPFVKLSVFKGEWNEIFSCTNNCNDTETFFLSDGEYRVRIRLYDYDWNLICDQSRYLVIGIDDNDNDGIPAEEDCDDYDPDLPAPAGTLCNDYDSSTTNDVIQSDGCTCEGTTIETSETVCDSIEINTTTTGISIANLDQPLVISKVKIFNENWSDAYSCTNCLNTEFVPLSGGTYHINITLYNSNWNPICTRTETVKVINEEEPPTNAEVDLALSLESDLTEFSQNEYFVYTLTLTNEGASTATDIQVDFPLPDGTAYTSHTTWDGDYSPWDGFWNIDQLAGGASVLLELTTFVVTDEAALFAFAQVNEVNENDIDSTPGNNYNDVPTEDDEAALTTAAADRSNHLSPAENEQGDFMVIRNVYPNPVRDFINIQIETTEVFALPLRIFNSAGVLQSIHHFETKRGLSQLRLNMTELPNGIYTILMETDNGAETIRFVKL